MTDAVLPIAAFVLTALCDCAWGHWHASVADCRPHAAASWSVVIFACGSVFTLTIVERNPIAYVAALAGAYCGTLWAVRRN